MRGLTKVAALLSATWVSAFVIPNSFETRLSGGVIDYSEPAAPDNIAHSADRWQEPSEASLEFTIDGSDGDLRHPVGS